MSLLDGYVERFNGRGDGSAVFAWAGEPTRPAGEMHVEARDGAVAHIHVLYERFSD